jgi:hypothetical protein
MAPIMKQIRPFVREDIEQVAELHQRIFGPFGKPVQRRLPSSLSQPYAQYFEEIFFRNPWYREDLPSLVYQDMKGRITGFLGVMCRQMSFNGRPIEAAVSSQFIVDPDSHSAGAAISLLKTFLSGPQDLSIADESNDVGRKIWEALGGTMAPLYSFRWTRPLQPGRFALSLFTSRFLGKGLLSSILTSGAKPLCNVVDSIGARKLPHRFHHPEPQVSGVELDDDTLLVSLSRIAEVKSLSPVYNASSLNWMLRTIAQKRGSGALRKMAVHNSKKDAIGWYLYYLVRGGKSTALQIVARKGSFRVVLDHLCYDARQQNSLAVTGRLDPDYTQEFPSGYCSFNYGVPWMLIHSRDPDILRTIQSGKAFLSMLEGEWCTRRDYDLT